MKFLGTIEFQCVSAQAAIRLCAAALVAVLGSSCETYVPAKSHRQDAVALASVEDPSSLSERESLLIIGPATNTASDWKTIIGIGPTGVPIYARVSVRPPTSNAEIFDLYQENQFCESSKWSACNSIVAKAEKGALESDSRKANNLQVLGAIAGLVQVRSPPPPPTQKLLVARSEVDFVKKERRLEIGFEAPRVSVSPAFAGSSGLDDGERWTWLPASKGPIRTEVRSLPAAAEIWVLGSNTTYNTNTKLGLRRDLIDKLEIRKAGYEPCAFSQMAKKFTPVPNQMLVVECRLRASYLTPAVEAPAKVDKGQTKPGKKGTRKRRKKVTLR